MNSAETFSTMTHELAHVILHFNDKTKKETKTAIELEADAVACVVCESFGIEAIESSSDYIQFWNGDKKVLMERFERIRTCASEIIEGIEGEQDD